jgi:hypothetical protein
MTNRAEFEPLPNEEVQRLRKQLTALAKCAKRVVDLNCCEQCGVTAWSSDCGGCEHGALKAALQQLKEK